ncbi:MAG: hypothetical protein FJZ16_07195 [Candidatus Omnitrophica bacterium]|nr:hypothetical protein [Candidatus Omnitrophota bacterium]
MVTFAILENMAGEIRTAREEPHFHIVLPDPLTSPEMLSGALFLYFDAPIWVTMPPTIVTPDSWKLLDLIKRREPGWGEIFWGIFGAWRMQMDGFRSSIEVFTPLKEKSLKTMYMSYSAGTKALEESGNLITATGFTIKDLSELINPFTASGEIIRHIMLEQFLELKEDVEELYKYCGELLKEEAIPSLLTRGYLLRLKILSDAKNCPILLSNERLIKFLEKLPIDTEVVPDRNIDFDVIAWEFFRQLVSPRLDPLNAERADYIQKLIESRKNEIARLKSKCYKLAEKIEGVKSIEQLVAKVERLIKSEVEDEIAELFELDKGKVKEYFTKLFADKTIWIGTATTILGIVSGQPHVTVGGAICALSTMGAKAVSEAASRKAKIKQSDYAIVYRIGKGRN